jgi:hypothetical protein
MENGSVFHGFSTAISHWMDQWSMRVIQLIKIFDQTDVKQYDPADDKEDQNLWEACINFLNELKKSRRFANFAKNVGNRTIFRD